MLRMQIVGTVSLAQCTDEDQQFIL